MLAAWARWIVKDIGVGGAMDEGNDPVTGMRFPHAARLELDELLEQLVARARDVQDSQGRLRGLLRAYLAVARTDDLDVVLWHILEAARELVNARYAALGVIAEGRLVRFLHTGMADDVVAAIGHLPEGKGLLGLLVDYPQSLRLGDIAQHVASVGFPEHHPPMRSFLGVPIHVADRVFGNLYLTEKQGAAEFTADDEELAQALAAAAAVAIENATLLAESRRRQVWQAAMTDLTTALLGGEDPDRVLRRLVQRARDTLHAVGAGVTLPTADEATWRVAVTEGVYTHWQDDPVPVHGSATGAAIAAGGLVVIADPVTDERTTETGGEGMGLIGETVAVPIRGEHGITGVLLASRHPGEGGFDPLDREMICAVAAHAGLAVELAQVRHDNERLHLIEDRAEIAEDLRHRVIQRLFALGLALQGAASRATKPQIRGLIETQINEVDAIIREIRAAVFSLDRQADPGPAPNQGEPTGSPPG
jgi:GAF domain-containing protein